MQLKMQNGPLTNICPGDIIRISLNRGSVSFWRDGKPLLIIDPVLGELQHLQMDPNGIRMPDTENFAKLIATVADLDYKVNKLEVLAIEYLLTLNSEQK